MVPLYRGLTKERGSNALFSLRGPGLGQHCPAPSPTPNERLDLFLPPPTTHRPQDVPRPGPRDEGSGKVSRREIAREAVSRSESLRVSAPEHGQPNRGCWFAPKYSVQSTSRPDHVFQRAKTRHRSACRGRPRHANLQQPPRATRSPRRKQTTPDSPHGNPPKQQSWSPSF